MWSEKTELNAQVSHMVCNLHKKWNNANLVYHVTISRQKTITVQIMRQLKKESCDNIIMTIKKITVVYIKVYQIKRYGKR